MRSVQETVESYIKAFEADDAAAIADLFTEDGAVFPHQMATIRGRAAIESTFKSMFQVIGLACERLDFDRVEEFGDTAVAETRTRETVTNRAENSSGTTEYRELFCLRREGSDWRILSYMFNLAG